MSAEENESASHENHTDEDKVEKDKVEKDKVWETFTEVGTFERHFNQLCHQYRVIASTWILGTFVGTGFVLSTELDAPFPKEILISLIGFLGAIGLTLLWTLDDVYLQMTDACFRVGCELENTYDWLPMIRRNMLVNLPMGVRQRFRMFYMVSLTVALLIGVTSLVTWVYNLGGATRAAYVSIFALLVIVGWNFLMYRR